MGDHTIPDKRNKQSYSGWGLPAEAARVGWVLGEAGEGEAVIMDGTSAELQVSVISLLSSELTDDFTPCHHAVYSRSAEQVKETYPL